MTPGSKNTIIRTSPTWVLLPLRLFLGITFIYAGIQKVMDPQFFNPSANGYIGKQMAGFVATSPLHSFLTQIAVPHATLFGLLVIVGELAIGAGTLIGFLLRPAAFFGIIISLVFFLTASWRVYPYFYGADIVFVFSWITLLLNGPQHTGIPELDSWLANLFLEGTSPERQARLAPLLAVLLGTTGIMTPTTQQIVQESGTGAKQGTPPQTRVVRNTMRGFTIEQRNREARRNFLLGALTGGVGALSLAVAGFAFAVFRHDTPSGTQTGGTLPQQPPTPIDTPAANSTPTVTQKGNVIAQVSAVPSNSAVSFTIPASGDAGVLVHLDNGQFVAYDAICTHAGCQVDYDPSAKLLVCPCHGAAFDPAKQAQVVNPPANTPLAPVSIHVDSATGAITIVS